MLLADEFLASIQRHRPDWVQAGGWAARANRLKTYRQRWRGVRAAPEQALVGLAEFDRQHRPTEIGLLRQQSEIAKLQRDRNVSSIEVVVPPTIRQILGDEVSERIDSQPASERFVRLASLEDWGAALFPDASRRNDLQEWTHGHLKSVDERGLAKFWLVDLKLSEVPHHSVRGLVRHLQPTRKVTESNRNDLDLANWLLRVDLVLTADKRFREFLLGARQQFCAWSPAAAAAKVGLVERRVDTLAAVQRAVAEAL
jgi:hypothetical protein